jgi:hypothetical protein
MLDLFSEAYCECKSNGSQSVQVSPRMSTNRSGFRTPVESTGVPTPEMSFAALERHQELRGFRQRRFHPRMTVPRVLLREIGASFHTAKNKPRVVSQLDLTETLHRDLSGFAAVNQAHSNWVGVGLNS